MLILPTKVKILCAWKQLFLLKICLCVNVKVGLSWILWHYRTVKKQARDWALLCMPTPNTDHKGAIVYIKKAFEKVPISLQCIQTFLMHESNNQRKKKRKNCTSISSCYLPAAANISGGSWTKRKNLNYREWKRQALCEIWSPVEHRDAPGELWAQPTVIQSEHR